MAYTALKPCKFAGQAFKIGEHIPDELVQPGAAKNLIKASVIARKESKTSDLISLLIPVEEGDLQLELTPEGIQSVFDVLNSNVTNAVAIIKEMTDVDALILIDIQDTRKSVKEATEARGKELAANG